MKIISIPKDGDCLFRSCAYYLGIDHRILRQKIADIIRNVPYLLIGDISLHQWLSDSELNPKTYSNYISQSGVFGSGLELAIISIVYRRNIIVMQPIILCHKCGKISKDKFIQIADYFPKFKDRVYLLFYPDKKHYDVLEM